METKDSICRHCRLPIHNRVIYGQIAWAHRCRAGDYVTCNIANGEDDRFPDSHAEPDESWNIGQILKQYEN